MDNIDLAHAFRDAAGRRPFLPFDRRHIAHAPDPDDVAEALAATGSCEGTPSAETIDRIIAIGVRFGMDVHRVERFGSSFLQSIQLQDSLLQDLLGIPASPDASGDVDPIVARLESEGIVRLADILHRMEAYVETIACINWTTWMEDVPEEDLRNHPTIVRDACDAICEVDRSSRTILGVGLALYGRRTNG